MLFFKRKKKEEEEEDELEDKPKKKKSKTRKKKEPKKPWGKKERLMVLIVFLSTVIASGVLSLRSRDWQLQLSPSFNIQKPNIGLFEEKTIVLYGTPDQQNGNSEVINQFLNNTSYLNGNYALYVLRLGSGYEYGVEKDRIMPAASLIKLPVMMALFIGHENGEIDLDEEYVLKDADKVEGSGSLYNQPTGFKITYRRLVELMGKQSDNTAFNIAKNILGDERINEVIDEMGMLSTSLETNETTPMDIGIFFDVLWNDQIISNEHRNELLEYLTNTSYEDWLAAGIPENVKVAHKYGTLSDVVNDAGIVYTDEPFVLVIMSERVIREEANGIFPELSRLIYEHETKI